MELIRECGASKGLLAYLLYAARIGMRMPPRQMLRSGWSFLKANLAALLPRKASAAVPRSQDTNG
jgi:hypothetical protein